MRSFLIFLFISTMAHVAQSDTTPPREGGVDIPNAQRLMAAGNFEAAEDLLLEGLNLNGQPDKIHYLLAECFKQTDRLEAALGANYKIKSSQNDSLFPKVLLQRTRLLSSLGLEDAAEPVGLRLIGLYPKSREARTCRKLLGMEALPSRDKPVQTVAETTQKKRFKPEFAFQSYLKYKNTSRPVSEGTGETTLPEPVLKDSAYGEWRSRSRISAAFSLMDNGRIFLQGVPRLEIKYPFDSSYSSRYALGGSLALERSPAAYKTDSWTLTYLHSWWDDYSPANLLSADWTRIREAGKKGYWMFSTTASYQFSGEFYHNGGDVNLTIYRNSAITFRKASLGFYFEGMASSFRDYDARLWEIPEFASGITDGDTNWTEADTIPGYQGLLIGSFISNTFFVSGVGVELAVPLTKKISIKTGGEGNVSYFPEYYVWDNLASYEPLVYNWDDNLFYRVDSNLIFRKYDYHTKRRMDNYFRFRLLLDLKLIGRLRFYFDAVINNSNIGSSSPYQFGYREYVPGVDWIFKF